MSKRIELTKETRSSLLKNTLNTSSSKAAWSFSKEKRFPNNQAICPFITYQKNPSSMNKRSASIDRAQRKLWRDSTESPGMRYTLNDYNSMRENYSFGLGREKCSSLSYIKNQGELVRNPGPGHYNLKYKKQKEGYTMRPQTSKNRTYFIENQELAEHPSPSRYDCVPSHGKNLLSKFKSVVLGDVAMKSNQERFKTDPDQSPGACRYTPYMRPNSRSTRIGTAKRKTMSKNSNYGPGPGAYDLPTDFGHYTELSSGWLKF